MRTDVLTAAYYSSPYLKHLILKMSMNGRFIRHFAALIFVPRTFAPRQWRVWGVLGKK
jgi:hypothetical protein